MLNGKNRNRDEAAGEETDDYVEVGRGDYCVVTVDRRDGSMVVHRFETKEEAMAQHRRNVEADRPMAGTEGVN